MKNSDEKQKEYLKNLGYSEAVINALFPKEEDGLLSDGSNLIKGFEVYFIERLNKI